MPPLGLFVSTRSYGDGTGSYGRIVNAALSLICTSFNASTSPNRVRSLALDHLTDPDGNYLSAPIDGLANYFDCFERVYIGTADNHFVNDLYCKGTQNKTFTALWVSRSVKAASRFAQEHASMPNLRWYLNYEAAGNYFATGCDHFTPMDGELTSASAHVSAEEFTSAYIRMFSSLTSALVKIRNVSIMWSPTFNMRSRDVADRPALLGNVTRLLRGVPLMREIANQDAIGKYSLYNISSARFTYNLTCIDTVYYQALLHEAAADAANATATPPVDVTVNMEMFSRRNTVPQSTITGDPQEHEQRRCCYASHGLRIGPSWEAKDWYCSQFVEWDPRVGATCEVPTPDAKARKRKTTSVVPPHPAPSRKAISCDILIAGGSTSALAAALTAAEADPTASVCLAEPTDWPGGQLTSSGVSAIDFGRWNRQPAAMSRSFRSLVAYLNRTASAGCWVSPNCYEPQRLVHEWIMPRIARAANLKLMLRTVVVGAALSSNGSLTSLRLVQRTPKGDAKHEWDALLSDSLVDWYAPADSPRFEKVELNVSAGVFIDATEFGDVLLTAGLRAVQGIEAPIEGSSATPLDGCGQASTLPFFMELLPSAPPSPDPAPAGGTAGGRPFAVRGCCCPASISGSKNCTFEGIWSYRRARIGTGADPSPTGWSTINAGDVTQQNWGNPSGNDLDNAYLFEAIAHTKKGGGGGGEGYHGGINLTALAMLEQRAYGWNAALRAAAPAAMRARLVLSRDASGTGHGLAKMPYLRGSRRAVGLGGFVLRHASEVGNASRPSLGERFYDRVGLGNYGADIHATRCDQPLPSYLTDHRAATVPFYLPFRALTHEGAANLLVAGKLMATSFFANAATRLHPCEWSSGVAAGGAAALMHRRRWASAAEALTHIGELQAFLASPAVGQVLEWKLGDVEP